MARKKGEGRSEGPSDQERQQEASKAANKAIEAQNKAKELTQAAAGAGDPQERQRLLNEALQKEMEAGSLGKTAKYLTSGSFQGLIAGTGVGTGIGGGLGALTGALTSGVLSILTGGIGAGVGAAHGPFIRLGDIAGSAVKQITGSIPGWTATPDQRKAIEKMLGQVNEQEMPSDQELSSMKDPSRIKVAAAEGQGQTETWTDYAASKVPSAAQALGLGNDEPQASEGTGQAEKVQPKQSSGDATSAVHQKSGSNGSKESGTEAPRRSQRTQNRAKDTQQDDPPRARTQPRKLERRTQAEEKPEKQRPPKRPRKLEVRS